MLRASPRGRQLERGSGRSRFARAAYYNLPATDYITSLELKRRIPSPVGYELPLKRARLVQKFFAMTRFFIFTNEYIISGRLGGSHDDTTAALKAFVFRPIVSSIPY